MKEKEYHHRKFMRINHLDLESIPDSNIKKRILGFEEIEDDLKHMVEEDAHRTERVLEKLDVEIYEDLEELYEDRLSNNQWEEEEQSKEKEKELQDLEKKLNQRKQNEKMEKEKLEQQKKEEELKRIAKTEANKSPDEKILDGFFKKGNFKKVSLSELRREGFKTSLSRDLTVVGSYRLIRDGFFNKTYTIEPVK